MKSLWIAIHHHRHGVDTFFLRAEREPSEYQFVQACNIDLEPDREDEYIEVELITNESIKEI